MSEGTGQLYNEVAKQSPHQGCRRIDIGCQCDAKTVVDCMTDGSALRRDDRFALGLAEKHPR